jgi:hypothetical protein
MEVDMRGRMSMVAVVAAILLVSGCADTGHDDPYPGPPGDLPDAFGASTSDGWPSTAPADIPPFPGHLDMILAGRDNGTDYGVRLFFSDVSTGDFDEYLATIKSAGYTVTGIVYYRDGAGAEEDANARAARGDYDAYSASNATRRLTITVPGPDGGGVTYDLDGLTLEESDAMNTAPWPAAWESRVPAPAGCALDVRVGILAASDTELRVNCTFGSTDAAEWNSVVEAYLARLESLGYDVAPPSGDGGAYLATGPGVRIDIGAQAPGSMQIHATVSSAEPDGWPAAWADDAPMPQGCTLDPQPMAMTSDTLMVACVYPDQDATHHQQVFDDYAALLTSAGFTSPMGAGVIDPGSDSETSRIPAPPPIAIATFTRGTLSVTVVGEGAPNGMRIQITSSAS